MWHCAYVHITGSTKVNIVPYDPVEENSQVKLAGGIALVCFVDDYIR